MKIDIEPIVQLLHRASYGALATHSVQMPGYPFASMAPFVTDECHRPVFRISSLAEHTKNSMADSRASLLIVRDGQGDGVANERLSLIGDVQACAASQELIARYVRYQPDAASYLGLGDFSFFLFTPKRARHVAGFGRMGWVEESEWTQLAVLPLPDETALMSARQVQGGRLLGVDLYGVDVEYNGRRERHAWPHAPVAADELDELINSLWQTAIDGKLL